MTRCWPDYRKLQASFTQYPIDVADVIALPFDSEALCT